MKRVRVLTTSFLRIGLHKVAAKFHLAGEDPV